MKHKNGWKQMILFCLTALLLFSPISAQARAGGGGSSSSSSGGGGGSSSSSHSSNYDDHNYRRSSRGRYSNNPMSSVIQYAIFICIASGGTIVFFYHRKKARLISKHRMTEFAAGRTSLLPNSGMLASPRCRLCCYLFKSIFVR